MLPRGTRCWICCISWSTGCERTYGAFERTFRLSASIDPNKIKATYNLGVLTITLPKAETARPRLIEVEVTPQKALNA